ncbi:uncharacterized protein LOC111985934 [Quercus suber]|uniref:uncharacterized protein LOC111985934 n=1 Tax=Quercus suber TaxID=58331 RepID=UPI000CE25A17|nr:uncharacterized protein LOC111985934 [Quercus suber]
MWDREMVEAKFHRSDAEAILHIPLSHRYVPDMIYWLHTKDGEYSVKSGYHIARLISKQDADVGESSREVTGSLSWAKLWKLKIPNKIRVFGWRACLDILPTRVNLARRKILADDRYGVCLQAKEFGYHVLWECGLAQDIWVGCSRRLQKELPGFDDMVQLDSLEEFQVAQARLTVSNSPSFVQQWRPPPSFAYKLNFDAAVFSDTCSSGFGAVIRNNRGEVMAAMSAKGLAVLDSEEVEVLACRRALEFAVDAGFEGLMVKGDNSTIIRCILSLRVLRSRLGNIYANIRVLAASSRCKSFSFVKCEANSVAHSLAKYAKSIVEDIFWMEETPTPAIEAVYLDSLFLNE